MTQVMYQIRPMLVEDIGAVLIVEQQSFATPWNRSAFIAELTNNQFSKYLVLEYNNKIIGYCGLWVVFDEAQITNIAIAPEFRGRGLGKQLLSYAIELTTKLGVIKMSLEVRVSNIVAQELYKKFGFMPGGIRKNYYVDNQEDALVMWVMLNEN